MIPEHTLKTAKTWAGEEVMGYAIFFRDKREDKPDAMIILVDETGTPDFTEEGFVQINVDPDTVKPVKVKPIKDFGWICPNCNQHFVADKMKHCSECGQALEW